MTESSCVTDQCARADHQRCYVCRCKCHVDAIREKEVGDRALESAALIADAEDATGWIGKQIRSLKGRQPKEEPKHE